MEKKQHLTSTTHEEQAPGWNEYLASSSEAHIKVHDDIFIIEIV
jgi:hypothetical protein